MLDAYTKGLVASATPCFGSGIRSTAACAGCPISAACRDARTARAGALVHDLVRKKMETDAARARARRGIQPPADPGGESFDDILDSIQSPRATKMSDLDFSTIFGDLVPSPDPSPAPSPTMTLRAVSDSTCGACGKIIINGMNCLFTPGQLLRHETCP